MAPAAPATLYFEASSPPSDAISAVRFTPPPLSSSSNPFSSSPHVPNRLLVSSWDRHLHVYAVHSGRDVDGGGAAAAEDQAGAAELVRSVEHRAPVLDACFGDDDATAYTAGMDWTVRRVGLDNGEMSVVGKHAAPVRCVVYSREHSLLISASWDKTLQIHSPSKHPSSGALSIALPGKPHALAASPTKVVVAMTSRLVHIYDLPAMAALFSSSTRPSSSSGPTVVELAPWQTRESPLKFLTRAVACMPSDGGYATSSIEGRVAVEWFEDTAESQARKYAFKCHRQAAGAGGGENGDAGGDVVYPVNALAFHPVHRATFASGGGDGTVALWDAEHKRRLRQYQKFPNSVAGVAFSADGRFMAVGSCPGFETGMEDYSGEGNTKVLIREMGENEAKGKGK